MSLNDLRRERSVPSLTAGRHPSVALWVGVALYAAVVSALHFGGLAYDIYTRIWWWDLMTHTASGFGVAAVGYLFVPRAFRRKRVAFLVVPALVLAVGAGFEVYERFFRSFWVSWSFAFYVEDTVVDLVCDVVGALVFAAVIRAVRARSAPR